MRVAIFGGGGFIGGAVAALLHDRGHETVVLDRFDAQVHGTSYERSPLYQSVSEVAEVRVGTILDRDAVREVLSGADVVVNLVAETGTGQSMYEVYRYSETNILGTAILLEEIAAMAEKPQRLVVASSRAIYGEGAYRCPSKGLFYPEGRSPQDLAAGVFGIRCPSGDTFAEVAPTPESAPLRPKSIYAANKLTQEQYTHILGKSMAIPTIALRYQNVYGPGQALRNPYTGLLGVFVNRIRACEPLVLFEDGNTARDFVYIDDVAEATYRSIVHEAPGQLSINVGSGVATTVREVADMLVAFAPGEAEVTISGKSRAGDIRACCADVSLAGEVLGFEARTPFASGIEVYLRWAFSQPAAEDKFEESMREMKEKGLYN